jgi:hypothetical protein
VWHRPGRCKPAPDHVGQRRITWPDVAHPGRGAGSNANDQAARADTSRGKA